MTKSQKWLRGMFLLLLPLIVLVTSMKYLTHNGFFSHLPAAMWYVIISAYFAAVIFVAAKAALATHEEHGRY